MKDFFVDGDISPSLIKETIEHHSSKTQIGAHTVFLGQVRSDIIENKIVKGIEYSAPRELANTKFFELKEECIKKFNLSCLHIYHSIGWVSVGKISLFVFSSSPHRREAFESLEWLVEQIKKEVPVYGKEVFEDDSYVWKENKF